MHGFLNHGPQVELAPWQRPEPGWRLERVAGRLLVPPSSMQTRGHDDDDGANGWRMAWVAWPSEGCVEASLRGTAHCSRADRAVVLLYALVALALVGGLLAAALMARDGRTSKRTNGGRGSGKRWVTLKS